MRPHPVSHIIHMLDELAINTVHNTWSTSSPLRGVLDSKGLYVVLFFFDNFKVNREAMCGLTSDVLPNPYNL